MKRYSFASVLCVVVISSLHLVLFASELQAQQEREPHPTSLFPIEVKSKWGFIDKRGDVLIEPQFDMVSVPNQTMSRFPHVPNNSEYLVSASNQFFYVAKGKVQRKLDFSTDESVKRFEFVGDSMFRVVCGPPWSYQIIDMKGKFQLPDGFESPGCCLNQGMIQIRRKGNRLMGYADRNGRVVIDAVYELVGNFSEGLAAVMVVETPTAAYDQDRFGYIDLMGKFVIEPRFHSAGCFSNGLAPVILPLKPSVKIRPCSYISRSGEFVVDPGSIKFMLPFKDGLVAVENRKTGLWGYLNGKGEFAIKPQFQWAGTFEDGRAKIAMPGKNRHGEGYIDKSGKLVIDLPRVKRLENYSSGLAYVETGDGNGYIDTAGKWVWRLANE